MGIRKIIAISGFSGSGKDTVATMLQHNYNDAYRWTYTHPMAFPIKEAVKVLFQINDYSYEKKDQYNEFLTKIMKRPATYRDVINTFGTMCRKTFSDNIFVEITKNIYESWMRVNNVINALFIIPDIRFKVELQMLQEWRNEGKDVEHWIVLRESKLPLWCKLGYDFNDPIDIAYIKKEFKPPVAESEWCFENPKFKRVIRNDGTLEELEKQVVEAIKSFDPLWNTTTK